MFINLSKGTKESVFRDRQRRGAQAPYVDFNELLRADAGCSRFNLDFAAFGWEQRIGAGDGALEGAANLSPVQAKGSKRGMADRTHCPFWSLPCLCDFL